MFFSETKVETKTTPPTKKGINYPKKLTIPQATYPPKLSKAMQT
ncbi:hypothetical protein [uncultured Prochlorococcus sp.]|nr:hypothetical protein [uncultured Prochlorococcus sp.]